MCVLRDACPFSMCICHTLLVVTAPIHSLLWNYHLFWTQTWAFMLIWLGVFSLLPPLLLFSFSSFSSFCLSSDIRLAWSFFFFLTSPSLVTYLGLMLSYIPSPFSGHQRPLWSYSCCIQDHRYTSSSPTSLFLLYFYLHSQRSFPLIFNIQPKPSSVAGLTIFPANYPKSVGPYLLTNSYPFISLFVCCLESGVSILFWPKEKY